MTTETTPPPTPAAASGAAAGGQSAALTIDGQQYTIPPLNVAPHVLADEVDQYLASIQLHPMDALARSLTHLRDIKRPDLSDIMADAAFRAVRQESIRKPDPESVAKWIQSADGLTWLAWRAMKQEHPTLTLAKVKEALLTQARPAATTTANNQN